MQKHEILKEDLRDLYYQTENILLLLKAVPAPSGHVNDLERVKDNLVQKQVILGQAIKLFEKQV